MKNTKTSSEKNESANWGYENDVDGDVWKYASFTEAGAYTLAKTMKRMGCEILQKPTLREDGLWMFAFSNPLREIRRESGEENS